MDGACRVAVPSFTWPGGPEGIGPKLAEIGRTADGAGFSSLRVVDHFIQIEYAGAAEEPMLEGYSALNFLAGVTENVRRGAWVCLSSDGRTLRAAGGDVANRALGRIPRS